MVLLHCCMTCHGLQSTFPPPRLHGSGSRCRSAGSSAQGLTGRSRRTGWALLLSSWGSGSPPSSQSASRVPFLAARTTRQHGLAGGDSLVQSRPAQLPTLGGKTEGSDCLHATHPSPSTELMPPKRRYPAPKQGKPTHKSSAKNSQKAHQKENTELQEEGNPNHPKRTHVRLSQQGHQDRHPN